MQEMRPVSVNERIGSYSLGGLTLIVTLFLVACALTAAPISLSNPTPAITTEPTALPPTDEAVVVAFVKDGNIQLWDSGTNQSETIFSGGDVTSVTLSDDGQVIAFTRRSFFEQPNVWEQSALWAVDRDGKNPRELVSAETVRKRILPRDGDSFGAGVLAWVPGTHRLVYNVGRYFLPGQGAFNSPDVYLIDSDTLADTVLAQGVVPADQVFNSVNIVPSPDGQQLALITGIELSFINADGSNWRKAIFTYPSAGGSDAGIVMPVGVWAQDSRAFVITGSFETNPTVGINFTVWRVPVDGSAPESLATVSQSHPGSVTFSPDGKSLAFIQADAQHPEKILGWFIAPLTGNVGPLAIPYDFEGGSSYANLRWSPAGKVYTGNLLELCPNATRDSDVCETPFYDFSGDIAAIHWIDGTHLLFMTSNPPVLFWGNLDGKAIPIVAWSSQEISHSFAAVLIPQHK